MFIIRCKPFLINRLILTFLLGGNALVLCILLLLFKVSINTLTTSMLFFSSFSVVITFYLTKNEVYTLTVTDNEIHLDFFNKSIFKRVPMKLNKEQFARNSKEENTDLYIEDKIIARIRKRTMTEEEWQKLQHFFND